MKTVCSSILFGFALLTLSAGTAHAVPAFDKHFKASYVDEDNGNPKFVEATKEAKCNVCHVKGKKKEERNDYGMALSKFLDKDNFKTARVKAEPAQVEKELIEAFKKAEEMKSVNGKSFGELIKAGELPGTPPVAE